MTAATTGAAFAPVDNEWPLRFWRRLHLVPQDGLGTARRALLCAAVAWLPIVTWALVARRLVDAGPGESLLAHFGVHVRCLLAIPLLILAEGPFQTSVLAIARRFVASGCVAAAQQATFAQAGRDAMRWRDATLPWILVLGAAIAWTLVDPPAAGDDTLSWAIGGDGRTGFGGWWYVNAVRPLFLALVFAWIWRMLLVAAWLWQVGKLGLSLVPSHPDRAGGLGFVEALPGAFAGVGFALSAVVAARFAHDLEFHGATLHSFIHVTAAFAIVWTALALLPLVALAPALAAARGRARPAYADLVGEQGRLVHRRWILRAPVAEESGLEPAGVGPVADAAALYDAVHRMRSVPVGRKAVMKVLLPIALPLLVVVALQIPLKDVLLKLLKTLA